LLKTAILALFSTKHCLGKLVFKAGGKQTADFTKLLPALFVQ